jgi:hypothetical protein
MKEKTNETEREFESLKRENGRLQANLKRYRKIVQDLSIKAANNKHVISHEARKLIQEDQEKKKDIISKDHMTNSTISDGFEL